MWSILIETKPLQKDWKTEAMSPSRPSGRLRLAKWYFNYTLNFIKKYILYTNFISIHNRTQKQ